MPDIAMCMGGECPQKKSCYRYRAEPHEYRQGYFAHPPFDRTTKKCEHYWEMDAYEKSKSRNLKDIKESFQ